MNKACLSIGHRGAKGYISENTIPSIQKALEFGVDGIEIDVHQCHSNEIVVFHDVTLERLTNGEGEVSQFNLEALKALKIKDTYQIPTLHEVLDVIGGRCMVNIELKGANTAHPVVDILNSYLNDSCWDLSNFLLSSFQYNELKIANQLNSKIPLAVLTKASINDALEIANQVKAVAIHPHMELVSENLVRSTQEKGYKLNVWTVNEFHTIDRFKKYGVDGIISDFPDRI